MTRATDITRPRRQRRLSAEDDAVWAQFTRQIAVLPGRRMPPVPQTAPSENRPPALAPPALAPPALAIAEIRPAPPMAPRTNRPDGALAIGAQPGGVDKATWQRFRAGKLPVGRTLDLHGRTAQRAFHALMGFLRVAQAEGVRCVEVITGRGAGETGGVLKRELPHWLNLPELRPLILGAAHPHVANSGSVRLLLRRVR